MKASLKFREEQKPLFRAKVPLSILGLPFQSGIVAGESKELSLNLSTFFESGPAVKIAYRPNDSWNPFSLIVKTGTGPFGSPIAGSMQMSAEFNLIGRGNPNFMLHLKPRFGDFSIRKSHASSTSVFDKAMKRTASGGGSEEDSSIEVVERPAVNGGSEGFEKITVLPSTSAGDIVGLISGMELAARTALPVRGHAVVNFRWGVRVPTEINHYAHQTSRISLKRFPFLVMNKIGIEHADQPNTEAIQTGNKSDSKTNSGGDDVAEACLAVKRQLEVLQAENGLLKRVVDELRQDIANLRPIPPPQIDFGSSRYRETDRNGGKARFDRRNNEKMATDYGKKAASLEGDMAEELKKALKGAT